MSQSAPGWYQDHDDPRLARWWDGERWTEHTLVLDEQDWSTEPEPPAGSTRFPVDTGSVTAVEGPPEGASKTTSTRPIRDPWGDEEPAAVGVDAPTTAWQQTDEPSAWDDNTVTAAAAGRAGGHRLGRGPLGRRRGQAPRRVPGLARLGEDRRPGRGARPPADRPGRLRRDRWRRRRSRVHLGVVHHATAEPRRRRRRRAAGGGQRPLHGQHVHHADPAHLRGGGAERSEHAHRADPPARLRPGDHQQAGAGPAGRHRRVLPRRHGRGADPAQPGRDRGRLRRYDVHVHGGHRAPDDGDHEEADDEHHEEAGRHHDEAAVVPRPRHRRQRRPRRPRRRPTTTSSTTIPVDPPGALGTSSERL